MHARAGLDPLTSCLALCCLQRQRRPRRRRRRRQPAARARSRTRCRACGTRRRRRPTPTRSTWCAPFKISNCQRDACLGFQGPGDQASLRHHCLTGDHTQQHTPLCSVVAMLIRLASVAHCDVHELLRQHTLPDSPPAWEACMLSASGSTASPCPGSRHPTQAP